MTADDKTNLRNRVAKVNEAINSFPDSIPTIDSVTISGQRTVVRLYIHRDYSSSRAAEFRKVAQLAASFSTSINIERRYLSTGKQIRVEFVRLGVQFQCINDIDTPGARALVKAIDRKLTAEPLVISAAEFLKAVDATEGQS